MHHRFSSPTPLEIAETIVIKKELKSSNASHKNRIRDYWDRMSQTRQPNKLDKTPKPKQSTKRTFCISKDFSPPRIDQLCSPTLPRLEGLLQAYHQILTPACITRVVTLIHQKVAEPPKLKVYTKRQKKRKKKPPKRCRKKEMVLRWLDKQAEISSLLIMRHLENVSIQRAPNYRQVLLATELLRVLHVKGTKQCVRTVLNHCEQLAIIADVEWEPFSSTGEFVADLQSELTQTELPQEKKVVRYIISDESLLDDNELDSGDSEVESLATAEQRALANLDFCSYKESDNRYTGK